MFTGEDARRAEQVGREVFQAPVVQRAIAQHWQTIAAVIADEMRFERADEMEEQYNLMVCHVEKLCNEAGQHELQALLDLTNRFKSAIRRRSRQSWAGKQLVIEAQIDIQDYVSGQVSAHEEQVANG